MKFRFVIILFSVLLLSSGCQTIKQKSDDVVAKENEKFDLKKYLKSRKSIEIKQITKVGD